MRILLSTTQHHFRASAEEDRAVRNIAATKSTAEPPAFDLTFDKAGSPFITIATGGSESSWAVMWRWIHPPVAEEHSVGRWN
jgi:hypothetical protein